MASIYKFLNDNDVVSTKTLLHEAIPLTGTIVSGTYSDNNIKNYSHGMFQSVYDYPYLSSSANHIFDITVGYHATSGLSSSANSQNAKKINMYNQLAQICFGYDANGAIQKFDADGDLTGGDKIEEAIFFTFSRLLVKDEIKKGSFALTLGVNSAFATPHATNQIKITDKDGVASYKVNSPVGEYGLLYASNSAGTPIHTTKLTGQFSTSPVGLVFYQAGIVALTSSIFMSSSTGFGLASSCNMNAANKEMDAVLSGSQVSASADAIRHRINNIAFNNTTELNSTIYFCRVNHNEFNYSANPTYLSGSEIIVKNSTQENQPISYITTVGLYSSDNTLMAVGKLSEPLRKDPTIEYTLRARLDY
jgi:hypothetical protein